MVSGSIYDKVLWEETSKTAILLIESLDCHNHLLTAIRTTAADARFISLINALDADLWNRYQPYQAKYDGFNKVDESARVVVVMQAGQPVGCGCFRPMKEPYAVEIKRMFVDPAFRGIGVAKLIVQELERWAIESGYTIARLETGNKQPEAVGLYQRMGYQRIENYPPYVGFTTSICMEKKLHSSAPAVPDLASREVWLRGPLPDMPPLVQPVAHALLQAREEVQAFMEDFPDTLLWERPAGVASVGFHLQHLTGVLDRLLTYARGELLSSNQLEALSMEGKPVETNSQTNSLVNAFSAQIDLALAQLRTTDEKTLTDYRGVGRAQLPSTVLGLLVHAAEHTQRHVGQLLVTARVVRSR